MNITSIFTAPIGCTRPFLLIHIGTGILLVSAHVTQNDFYALLPVTTRPMHF